MSARLQFTDICVQTTESETSAQCGVSQAVLVRCWGRSGTDSLAHHPRPRREPRPLLQPLRRPPTEVRPLRAGHQLPDGASWPGEAEDRPQPAPHQGHDGRLREGPAERLAGPGPAPQCRGGVVPGLQQTRPHTTPQAGLQQAWLSHQHQPTAGSRCLDLLGDSLVFVMRGLMFYIIVLVVGFYFRGSFTL